MGVGQDDDNWKVGCTATGEGKFNACSCLRAEPFQQHMRATDCLDVSHVYGFPRSPRNSAVCPGDCVDMFLPSAGEEISTALHRSRGISIGAGLSSSVFPPVGFAFVGCYCCRWFAWRQDIPAPPLIIFVVGTY